MEIDNLSRICKRILITIGTRPEAIKMAPVVRALRQRSEQLETFVVATAQHRQMLDQVLELFQIKPDLDLDLMRPNQSLTEITSRILEKMGTTLAELRPDLLLVEGDTTTIFASALAAYYVHVPVGHVEAGLRSHDIYNPFPEEINRKLTTGLAQIHFAPTPRARTLLLQEGIAAERIVVTGNTVVDALCTVLDAPFSFEHTALSSIPWEGFRTLLVTAHRRESWGQGLENICLALKDLVSRFKDLQVVYPVHLNPNVQRTVHALLDNVPRVHLTEPLDYLTFVNLMKRCDLMLTDSGGLQEEAPTLRKPLLLMRKLTERPEGFESGLSEIVGTERQRIVERASKILSDPAAYRAMTWQDNPYGDGKAAERIAETVCRWAEGKTPLLEPEKEFLPAVGCQQTAENRGPIAENSTRSL